MSYITILAPCGEYEEEEEAASSGWYFDDFARANENPFNDANSDFVYWYDDGETGDRLVITDEQVKPNPSGPAGAVLRTPALDNTQHDCYIEAEITNADSGGPTVNLRTAYSDINDLSTITDGYVSLGLVYPGPTSIPFLFVYRAGAPSFMPGGSTTAAAPAMPYTSRWEVIGDTLYWKVNGEVVFQTTDPSGALAPDTHYAVMQSSTSVDNGNAIGSLEVGPAE